MDQSVIPTKSNLLAAKNTLATARLGYDMLDRKRNVLIREIMELSEKAKAIQEEIDLTFAEAYDALQNANIAMGIAYVHNQSLRVPVDEAVRIRERSVMGVLIPLVSRDDKGRDGLPPFSLINTSPALDVAFVRFRKVKELIIELSMVENSAYRLAMGIKRAQKRANALKNIMIPKYEALVKSISETLEERERDEFTRLKVIKRGM